MDFGLVLGILITGAVCAYLWMSRGNKLDGLDGTPSDCEAQIERNSEVDPAEPAKAEPVFAKAVIAPEAVEPPAAEEVLTPPQKPKAKAKAKAAAVTREELEAMTKKQIDELAAKHGVELDARKTKAVMIDTFLESL